MEVASCDGSDGGTIVDPFLHGEGVGGVSFMGNFNEIYSYLFTDAW